MKKTFLILELVFVIVILGILYTVFTPKLPNYKLDEVTNRVLIYLNYTKYKALVDDKFEKDEAEWFKRRWTMKFMRCREDKGGGIYFTIYSETNDKGHTGKKESLKDPLTNRYIFTSNYCEKNLENSPFVLLKNYNIEDVQVSCNTTTSIGQISFGNDGRVYTQLSSENLELKKPCTIRFISKTKEFRDIKIYPKTGYIEKINN